MDEYWIKIVFFLIGLTAAVAVVFSEKKNNKPGTSTQRRKDSDSDSNTFAQDDDNPDL